MTSSLMLSCSDCHYGGRRQAACRRWFDGYEVSSVRKPITGQCLCETWAMTDSSPQSLGSAFTATGAIFVHNIAVSWLHFHGVHSSSTPIIYVGVNFYLVDLCWLTCALFVHEGRGNPKTAATCCSSGGISSEQIREEGQMHYSVLSFFLSFIKEHYVHEFTCSPYAVFLYCSCPCRRLVRCWIYIYIYKKNSRSRSECCNYC